MKTDLAFWNELLLDLEQGLVSSMIGQDLLARQAKLADLEHHLSFPRVLLRWQSFRSDLRRLVCCVTVHKFPSGGIMREGFAATKSEIVRTLSEFPQTPQGERGRQ